LLWRALIVAVTATLSVCSVASGQEIREGILKTVVADDFARGQATIRHWLKTPEENLPLLPTDSVSAVSGEHVRAIGERFAGNLVGTTEVIGAASSAVDGGPRTIAVVRVATALPPGTPQSESEIRDKLFYAPTSANNFFEEESYGRISLTGIHNPDGDILGPYVADAPIPDEATCPTSTWADEAGDAATVEGVPLAQYDHVVYLLPGVSATGCGAAAATIGGSYIIISGETGEHLPLVHEISHNLGLRHANRLRCQDSSGAGVPTSQDCLVEEYGDPFDVMGSTYRHSLGFHSFHHSHGFFLNQLGILAPSNVQAVEVSGTYLLTAAKQPTLEPTVLRVPTGGSSEKGNGWYDLEIREADGVFERDDSSTSGVTIRASEEQTSRSSLLIDTSGLGFSNAPLGVGKTFADGSIAITTLEAGSGRAKVKIEVPIWADRKAPSGPPAPKVSVVSAGVGLTWAPSSDNVGVVEYLVYRNGQLIGTTGDTAFVDSAAPLGASAYTVRARDKAGNKSIASPPTVVVLQVPNVPVPLRSGEPSETATAPIISAIQVEKSLRARKRPRPAIRISPRYVRNGGLELQVKAAGVSISRLELWVNGAHRATEFGKRLRFVLPSTDTDRAFHRVTVRAYARGGVVVERARVPVVAR
jgi:hypothetical protein